MEKGPTGIVQSVLMLIFFALLSHHVQGQKDILPIEDLIDHEKIKYFKPRTFDELGQIRILQLEEDPIWEVQTFIQPKFNYQLSQNIPGKKTYLKPGQKLLLQFKAKTSEANYLETGEGRLSFRFKVSENRKKRKLQTFSIPNEWTTFYYPLEILEPLEKTVFSLSMHFGFPPQRIQIKDLHLYLYDESVQLAELPKSSYKYEGMESDAEWRKGAAERIEKYRKGDLQLGFYKEGLPLDDVHIQLEQIDHYFKWGAMVKAQRLVEDEAYIKHLKNNFNLLVFGNDLKIKHWKKFKSFTQKAFDILEENEIETKGHVLIWPGFNHLTPYFRKNKTKPAKLKRKMEDHVEDILEFSHGKVGRWDVVNEAYTNNDLQRILGSEELLYDGFRALYEKEALVLRFVNEYGILSKGGFDQAKQDWYYTYCKRVDENTDGLLDGIGMQGHMGTDLTGINRVYEIVDRFATLGKNIGISEFTMEIKDPEIRYNYTKDFMTILFSHPSVHEFLFWGFNDKDQEKVDIFDKNWQKGNMGKAFFDLTQKEWKTRLIGKGDSSGKLQSRAFFGSYEYTIVYDEKVVKGRFNFGPETSEEIKIELK